MCRTAYRAPTCRVARRSRPRRTCRLGQRVPAITCTAYLFSRAHFDRLYGAPPSNISEPHHVHTLGLNDGRGDVRGVERRIGLNEDVQERRMGSNHHHFGTLHLNDHQVGREKDVKRLPRSYAWYALFLRKSNNTAPRQRRSPQYPRTSRPCKCYFYINGVCVCRNPFIRSTYCASCLYFISREDGRDECICSREDLDKEPRLRRSTINADKKTKPRRQRRSIMLYSELFTESLMFQFCSATRHGAYKIDCVGDHADFFKNGYTVDRSNATANVRVGLSALYTFLSREVYRMAQLLPAMYSNDALDHLYQLEKIFCRDYYDFTRNLTTTPIYLCPVLVGLVGDLTEVRVNADPQAQSVDFGRKDLDLQQVDFICSRRPNLCANLVQWLHTTDVLDIEADTYTFKPETPNYYPLLSGCFTHPEKCQQLYTILRSETIEMFHPLSFELVPSESHFDGSSTALEDSTDEISDQPSPVSNVCNCECSCGAQTWRSSCNYNHPIVNDTLTCTCLCNCAEPNPSSCFCETPRHRVTRETTGSPQIDYWPDDHFNVHPTSNVDGYASRDLEHNAEQHVVDVV